MSEQPMREDHEARMMQAEEVRLLREEARQANERADRIQRDSTAELLKHREEKAGMLQKIADQKALIHDLNTRHLENVTLAGVRDRRIAALEAAMNPQDIADVDAALAGKGVSRG